MPEIDNMLKEFKEFLVDGTTGPLMALLRAEGTITHNTVKFLYKIYLNMCWHSYNKKDDINIVSQIDELLSFNIIKGSVCLLNWMMVIGNIMIVKLDLNNMLSELVALKTLELKRKCVRQNMSSTFDKIKIELNKLKCEGKKCDNTYNGTDLFQ